MEVIIIITKEVPDQAAAESVADQFRNFVKTVPALNDPLVNINIETRNQIEQG